MADLSLKRSAASWREVDGETVVLDIARSEYLGVNESGTVLWGLLAEGTTEQALESSLVDSFGITPEAAHDDVSAFLADARARGLLDE